MRAVFRIRPAQLAGGGGSGESRSRRPHQKAGHLKTLNCASRARTLQKLYQLLFAVAPLLGYQSKDPGNFGQQ